MKPAGKAWIQTRASNKDHPNLMSQMHDLLWEMVTEPLFWPVMLVLAGTFAYLEVTS